MKLEFKHVTKRYSEVAAVREVNCVMEQGIYGLLESMAQENNIDADAVYDHPAIGRRDSMEWQGNLEAW